MHSVSLVWEGGPQAFVESLKRASLEDFGDQKLHQCPAPLLADVFSVSRSREDGNSSVKMWNFTNKIKAFTSVGFEMLEQISVFFIPRSAFCTFNRPSLSCREARSASGR